MGSTGTIRSGIVGLQLQRKEATQNQDDAHGDDTAAFVALQLEYPWKTPER
jgi:hypothetical protein